MKEVKIIARVSVVMKIIARVSVVMLLCMLLLRFLNFNNNMQNDDLKNNTPTDANNVLAVVFNVFTNEFGDRITNQGSYHDKQGYAKCYSITIDGKYIKSVGGIKIAKSFINKKRGVKCKWVGSVE